MALLAGGGMQAAFAVRVSARCRARSRVRVVWMVPSVSLACFGGPTAVPLRPEPIPYADTLPIAEPRDRPSSEASRVLDAPAVGEVSRLFSIRRWAAPDREAVNLTHFDDVVSSAWFEHRIDSGRLTPEDVARGPTATGPRGVFTIIGPKNEGRSPGFLVRDARGDAYLFKFDPVGFLHLTTAAEVISSRLLYAAGYYTPEEYIVAFDGSQLVLDPGARIPAVDGGGGWTRPVDVQRFLARLDRLPDGRFLAVASKIVPGVPKGPFRFRGRRSDDPNDYYHHEHRRELRGLSVLAAWLNYADIRFTNTVDTYLDPGYLRHYLIDFGETLGSGTVRPQDPRAGREHNFDLVPTLARLFSLGFFRMPWETTRRGLIHPSIGAIPVEDYRPEAWKPRVANPAFSQVTPRDGYWGAKLVAAFTDAQIRAAVGEGMLSDTHAADTLASILVFRRDRTVVYWYSLVTPIEHAHVDAASVEGAEFVLTFEDLGLRHRVWETEETVYRWEFSHAARGIEWRGTGSATHTDHQSIAVMHRGDGNRALARVRDVGHENAIATLRITAERTDTAGRPVHVYLAWDGERGSYAVVGIEH